jgi:uncharacterized membrane protein YgcG
VAQVPAGNGFTTSQTEAISRAVRLAREQTGLGFSVYVGAADGKARPFAEQLLAQCGAEAASGVLVLVDPDGRQLEIVTGPQARKRVDDRSCALASLSMTSAFSGGDLAGGIVDGLRLLAQAGTRPKILHAD